MRKSIPLKGVKRRAELIPSYKNLTRSRQGAKKTKIYDEKANLSLKHSRKAKILAAKSPEWGLRLSVEKYFLQWSHTIL